MTEIEYPGIAQLVARLIWVQEAERSNRSTRTKIPLKSLISEGFFLFFVYCGAEGEKRIFNVCQIENITEICYNIRDEQNTS